ncbi:MAG: deoxyribose-phosphate aldolase [Mucinivorans sp.]
MKDYTQIVDSARKALLTTDRQQASALCLSCTDHTTLSERDTPASVAAFTAEAIKLKVLPAAICVYPSLVESVGVALGDSPIALAAVCGAFPSGQTYMEVKLLETAMAVENGAEEVDMVINIGAILEGQDDVARSEIEAMVEEIDSDALLKVIIESGTLLSNEKIAQASWVAMCGGADFIKSSTGKSSAGASPEAVAVMCVAIKEFYEQTGKRVGIKCSGGINTMDHALLYYNIVREVLGSEWLTPSLLRFGSSRLALTQLK